MLELVTPIQKCSDFMERAACSGGGETSDKIRILGVRTTLNIQLGITRIAQASSVNVVTLVWSQKPKLYYVPLDEEHPCEPDEPYGLSKL